MSHPTVKVAAVQMDPSLGEVAKNLDAMLSHLRVAAQHGAKQIVYPESSLTGYGFGTKDEALAYGEPADGPSTAAFASVCRELDVFAVFGMLEREGDDLFNTCVLTGPEGFVASYRKVHLPYLGVDRFVTPGDRPFAVHDVLGMKIGMHICYDSGFPETARVLSLLGADLLVLPTNWPTHGEKAAEHMIPCRAMENVVYVMAVNRVGDESGFNFIGRSSIASPSGDFLAWGSPDREEILYAEIDPRVARQKRLIRRPGLHEIDRIADRRPGFYGPITAANGRE